MTKTVFKINNHDYSMYISSLKVSRSSNYNAQTNAAGDTVVEYINAKRTIEVGIIPLDAAAMSTIISDINSFNVEISFLNPDTHILENNVNCIIPSSSVEYYTIQNNRTMFKALTLTFTEL